MEYSICLALASRLVARAAHCAPVHHEPRDSGQRKLLPLLLADGLPSSSSSSSAAAFSAPALSGVENSMRAGRAATLFAAESCGFPRRHAIRLTIKDLFGCGCPAAAAARAAPARPERIGSPQRDAMNLAHGGRLLTSRCASSRRRSSKQKTAGEAKTKEKKTSAWKKTSAFLLVVFVFVGGGS